MTSFTEKDLFTIFVELDKKGQLQLSEVNAVIKGKLNNTEVLEELDSIEKLLRNYRKLKSNHHKSKGYDYIVNLGSREIMLTAYENNIPQITKKLKIKPFTELDEKGKWQKQRTDNLVNMLQDYRENKLQNCH